jgi:hypothetical protein
MAPTLESADSTNIMKANKRKSEIIVKAELVNEVFLLQQVKLKYMNDRVDLSQFDTNRVEGQRELLVRHLLLCSIFQA